MYDEPARVCGVVLDNRTNRMQLRVRVDVERVISAYLPNCLVDDRSAPNLRLIVGNHYRHAGLAWQNPSSPQIMVHENHATEELILHELLHALLGARHCDWGIMKEDGQMSIEPADRAALAIAQEA